MKVQGAYLQCFIALWVVVWAAAQAAGQALYVDHLDNGTEVLVVAQPLADATTVVWPSVVDGDRAVKTVTSGDLTLVAGLETALGADGSEAPPVVVAVGGASVSDLRSVLGRILADRTPRGLPARDGEVLVEGRLERRLGAAGSEAEIRLEVNLPSPSDPMRSAVETLWDLLPEVLGEDLAGVRTRIDGDLALLEARTEASSADMAVSKLRLGLARFGENPALQNAPVEAAARRLQVRRQAFLEEHPQSAELLLELWLAGGTAAVREFLFGVDGVTVKRVQQAALSWLPQHPGNIVVTLPPRSFNPRFARPPTVMQLDNGLSAAVLQGTGSQLASLCLRPVVVPDLDSELAATILARLARELRELDQRPGWVRVDEQPAQIRLAASADQFSELTEVLRAALARAEEDRQPVMTSGGTARRRALRLMAGILGVAEGSNLSPATLLRTGNLSLGVVAEDVEAASEAVNKFWADDRATAGGASVRSVAPVPKIREAAAGDQSVLIVSLELAAVIDETQALVVAELLRSRGEELLAEGTVEILQPFIPGHRVLLVVASAEASMDVLETGVREGWAAFVAPPAEEELAEVRRRVAATNSAEWSGATGRACRCAAIAAGVVGWRTASDLEMSILSVPLDMVHATLSSLADFDSHANTGAGVLPIVELENE
jgi:hypothetical protein